MDDCKNASFLPLLVGAEGNRACAHAQNVFCTRRWTRWWCPVPAVAKLYSYIWKLVGHHGRPLNQPTLGTCIVLAAFAGFTFKDLCCTAKAPNRALLFAPPS